MRCPMLLSILKKKWALQKSWKKTSGSRNRVFLLTVSCVGMLRQLSRSMFCPQSMWRKVSIKSWHDLSIRKKLCCSWKVHRLRPSVGSARGWSAFWTGTLVPAFIPSDTLIFSLTLKSERDLNYGVSGPPTHNCTWMASLSVESTFVKSWTKKKSLKTYWPREFI